MTALIVDMVSLSIMLLVRVLFVIISNVTANPVPVDQYPKDPNFDSTFGQQLSAFGPLYSDQNFEVSTSIIPPILELDASEVQPLGFTTTLNIVQDSQSPPGQTSDESYIKSQAQIYQSFRCRGEKSVCCPDENTASLGSISLENCDMSISPLISSLYLDG